MAGEVAGDGRGCWWEGRPDGRDGSGGCSDDGKGVLACCHNLSGSRIESQSY